ncbi:MAG: GNAT family N-acetyltransferase [Enhydrobacter sp.]|nr:MAG: GNAT family N-acetyltransferase [Enhydrobacter sp.]
MTPSTYDFRPAGTADLPLFERWLRTPEVVRWWGDPDEQFGLLAEDLGEPRMTMLVVAHEDRPFAYAQHYDVQSWPQPHFDGLPKGTRAIDAFIGEPDMLGRGHGSAFLRQLAAALRRAGAPVVAIDPDVGNHRARRAYAKAGFHGDTVVETGTGPAVLMLFTGN